LVGVLVVGAVNGLRETTVEVCPVGQPH
jgi:hypothetical protein